MGAYLDKAGHRHIYSTPDEKSVCAILSHHSIPPIDWALLEVIPDRSGFYLRCRNERSYFLIERQEPKTLTRRTRDRAMEIETNYHK